MEIFKKIQGYDNYLISNCGKVINSKKNKMMKQYKDKDGYYRVALSKDNKTKCWFVHRLVANAFIPNINSLPMINHKNEIKGDNRVENLEWCTAKYNTNYGTCLERRSKTIKGKLLNRVDCSKKVKQFNIDGTFIKEYNSMMEASRITGVNRSNICLCCRNKIKQAKGYIWKYSVNSET